MKPGEREAIGERTAAAMQHKASRGEYTGGEPPFGYRRSADGARIEENAEEQAAIEIAKSLYAQQRPLRGIARDLEAKGIRSRTGRTFAPVQIRRIVG